MVNILGPPGTKATVLIFIREDCPISNRYTPVLQALQARFQPADILFRLVFPDPESTLDQIQGHMQEFGYTCEAIRDPEHALVKWTEVRTTPEVAVVLPDSSIVYRGRIDDQWVEFGKARLEPIHHDLRDVLSELAAGRSVEPSTTEAVGCFIADLK